MTITDQGPHGTISAHPTDRADLLAFVIDGKIEKEDIEWMARRTEAAFERLDEVDIILIMRNYDGAELSAVFNAEAMKAQAQSARHVRKYAVVGAPSWAKMMINAFSPFSPVEAKTFDLEEEAQAWAWVNALSA